MTGRVRIKKLQDSVEEISWITSCGLCGNLGVLFVWKIGHKDCEVLAQSVRIQAAFGEVGVCGLISTLSDGHESTFDTAPIQPHV